MPSKNDSNVIVVNEAGLGQDALGHVLSPFSNSRKFSGIEEAATHASVADEDLDDDAACFARVIMRK
jgi:hypothetical protein